jgi:hypothetical protein
LLLQRLAEVGIGVGLREQERGALVVSRREPLPRLDELPLGELEVLHRLSVALGALGARLRQRTLDSGELGLRGRRIRRRCGASIHQGHGQGQRPISSTITSSFHDDPIVGPKEKDDKADARLRGRFRIVLPSIGVHGEF